MGLPRVNAIDQMRVRAYSSRGEKLFMHALSRRVFLATGASLAACASQPRRSAELPRLKALIDRYVGGGKLAGATISLEGAGVPLTHLTAGQAALQEGPPVDENTLWRLYSMTKPVIGVAVMRLVEDGKLALDQPLATIVPAFKDMRVLDGESERPAKTAITIRHLLTHTAGFSYSINGRTGLPLRYAQQGLTPGGRDAPAPGMLAQPTSLEEFGARLAALPLQSEPGARYEYSIAIDVLGLVIQTVSGRSLEDYLRETIFAPLDMQDTGFVVAREKAARLSTFYAATPRGLAVADDRNTSWALTAPPFPSGGGGLIGSARDYARFGAMMLNDGRLGRARVLKPQTMALARSNLLPPGVDGPLKAHFGAAMGVQSAQSAIAGEYPVGAFGWGGAAATTMWVDPVNRFYCVFMTQIFPSNAYPVWQEVRQAAYADLGIA
jgi:CubicO group peptidase (beta-lactamase class C family)